VPKGHRRSLDRQRGSRGHEDHFHPGVRELDGRLRQREGLQDPVSLEYAAGYACCCQLLDLLHQLLRASIVDMPTSAAISHDP
jgi:hypothetical protein